MPRSLKDISLFILLIAGSVFGQDSFGERAVRVADINGQALVLIKPAFPEIPEAMGADGVRVSVMVLINESGDVVHAECLATLALLKEPAEHAASTSKFKPLLVNGLAVRYWGFLIYTYVVDRVDWYRFGRYLETTRRMDNISLGPTADILSAKFSAEKARLSALDASGVEYEARNKGLAEVESEIRSKIKGVDLWRFELGMALRKTVLWTNRRDLQSALYGLAALIASAPSDVSKELIDDLTALSKYRISAENSDKILREHTSTMSLKIPQHPK